MMNKHILPGLATLSIIALTVTACGTADPAADAAGTGEATQKVSVGVTPIAINAPIFLGKEKGFFDEVGIDLDIQTSVGGAAAIPAVVSGSYHFADSNPISLMIAREKGLDIKFVTADGAPTKISGTDTSGVVVPSGSPIQSAADLAGKTVAVNTLANIGDTTIRHLVEEDGGDQTAIKFVEVAFPDAEAAIANKQVDAAWVVEPFLTKAVKNGARVVSYNFVDFDPNLAIDGYFATGDMIRNEPELVEKFQSAINKSMEYAEANPEEVRDIVGTYTAIDAELREEMILNSFPTTFDRDSMQKLGEAALKYGTLTQAPDLDELLP
ncbi:ABC transporter substrate-binding protein [Arthrobacter crystallopoietes]|uniref:ABC transporter substrate-binding protein n=1 Tax=Crystallibacter crystallopoietes TaxID=37928 RepID=UPI003211EB41